jgi:lysozyme
MFKKIGVFILGLFAVVSVFETSVLTTDKSQVRITSQKGLDLIKRYEGLSLKAYRCPAGILTIGYGHTSEVKKGQVITHEVAELLLRKDIQKCENTIKQSVKVNINQNQFDSLVSLCYNIGNGGIRNSNLLKLLNKGDYKGASAQFLVWDKVKGKTVKGLTNRRLAERELFNQ